MTNTDFEATQIWAKNLINASVPEPLSAPRQAAAKDAAPTKPQIKKLTKEEKLLLAGGGALAVGLGAIIVTSISSEDALPEVQPSALSSGMAGAAWKNDPIDDELSAAGSVPMLSAGSPKPPATPPKAPAAGPVPAVEIPENIDMATGENDELAFLEAFKQARAEVGSGGLFVWKNSYYSTFTDKEWESIPREEQEAWLSLAQPLMEPDVPSENEPVVEAGQEPVFVAEKGIVTWVGIDKDGDGQMEMLMARVAGQAPMIMMDTDGDGVLDTRYDYDPETGRTFASGIDPLAMSPSDLQNLEYVAPGTDTAFYTSAGNGNQDAGHLPVAIFEQDGKYLVSLDGDLDQTIDAVTIFSDDNSPLVGLDRDGDGRIEAGFLFDPQSYLVTLLEMEPLEELHFTFDTLNPWDDVDSWDEDPYSPSNDFLASSDDPYHD